MNKLIILQQDDINIINQQIKAQQKGIILFPFLFLFVFLCAIARNNGKMPEFYFYLLGIPFFMSSLYSPLNKGIFWGKIFYSIEKTDDDQVRLTTFGTLWRKEKVINVDLKDITIDKIPFPKLLYQKYSLNNIYIEGEKYRIFTSLLKESGMIE